MIHPIDLRDTEVWRMFQASWAGDLDEARQLVAQRPGLVRCEYNYTTPLHFAVREGHLALVQFLLDHGADPLTYRTYPFKDSLVTMAQDREHYAVAQYLLDLLSQRFPVAAGVAGFLEAARRGDLARVRAELARRPGLAAASDDTGDTA